MTSRTNMARIAVLILLLSSLLPVVPNLGRVIRSGNQDVPRGSTIVVDATGGGDYTHIQWAVDNASKGDTVYVEGGTYYENIVVNKTITLAGSSQEITIIDGNGNGNVIEITADRVNLTGLYVTNSKSGPYAGIIVDNADYCRLENNSCIGNNGHGILLELSNNNSLYNNSCISNGRNGIYLFYTSDTIISMNEVDQIF